MIKTAKQIIEEGREKMGIPPKQPFKDKQLEILLQDFANEIIEAAAEAAKIKKVESTPLTPFGSYEVDKESIKNLKKITNGKKKESYKAK